MTRLVLYVILIIKKYNISNPPPNEPINPKLPTIGSNDLKNFVLNLAK